MMKKKHSVHKSYKALGYLDDLIASGIDDPISFYKAEVDKMNKKVKKEKEELSIKKIGESPVKNLGYFLIKAIFNKLGVKFHLDLLDKTENETVSTYNYLSNMVSARIINLSSKDKILPLANPLYLNIDNYFLKLRMLKLLNLKV